MRILLVTDWTAEAGGIETYLELIATGLRAAGDEVALLTSSAGPAVHADYRAFGTERRAAQAFLQIANPPAALDVSHALADFRPDAVYVSMFEILLSPAVFVPLRRVRTVLNLSYYKPVCPTGHKLLPDGSICQVPAGVACLRNRCLSPPRWLREQPRYALIRAAIDSADAVVTCSRFMRAELARAGVDARWLAWPVEPPSSGFTRAPSADPHFVFTGRLSPEKGVDTLLHALALLRDRGLVPSVRIVGDGPERPRLEGLAASLGLGPAVVFVGRVPPCAGRAGAGGGLGARCALDLGGAPGADRARGHRPRRPGRGERHRRFRRDGAAGRERPALPERRFRGARRSPDRGGQRGRVPRPSSSTGQRRGGSEGPQPRASHRRTA